MAGVLFEHVRKEYAGSVVIDDFDLRVADGELVVLVGGSGCGKSTTLRMIAGLESISSGAIRIGERDVTSLPARERDVAMVFQDYALYPHLDVRENISLGLRLRRVPGAEIERRLRWAAGTLELGALLGRKPKQLSGGQRQRVAMARAMVREPAVFLFDEPLSNLDAQLRGQMRIEIGRLQRRLGTTTLYVTHDQVEAMTLGDRLVILEGGRIQQVGPPLELYNAPANRFVAGFIGSPPMNFLEGRLRGDGDGLAFECEGLRMPLAGRRLLPGAPEGAVTLGIRPEDLALAHESGPGTLTGRALLCEMLGATAHAHVEAGPHRLVAVVHGSRLPGRDETVHLAVRPEKAHLFGADGKSLGSGLN